MKSLYDVVYVEWLDTASGANIWVDPEYQIEPAVIQSVGFLLAQNKDRVRLVLSADVSNKVVSQIICIPIKYITSFKTLKRGTEAPLK